MLRNVEIIIYDDSFKDEYYGAFTMIRNSRVPSDSGFQPQGMILEICGNNHDPDLIERVGKACEEWLNAQG